MRGTLRILPIVVAAACSTPDVETSSTAQAVTQTFADVWLTHSNADLLQTSNTSWTLAKTGVLDTSTQTVTWTITTTKGATVGGNLVADGDLGLTNIGNGPATLGNIVVNLQTRDRWGLWHTIASDIADATNDDAATTAHVVAIENDEFKATFTKGPGSGHLYFMDRVTNTVFALVPEVTLPPFSFTPLLFSATFDNNILALPQNAVTRVEVIVTFGNHAWGGPFLTGHDIDINGNGIIDPDEHTVRSVSNIFDRNVPATMAANTSLTVTDAVPDITTMGTVTFSNPTFNLTTGIVTAQYSPGASGGSITNCAHAAGTGISDMVGSLVYTIVPPLALTACDTQTILQTVCQPGAPGCGWHDNDLVTWSQVAWGDTPTPVNAAGLLQADFDTVFAPESDLMEIGIPGSAGFSIIWSNPTDLLSFLPASGAPAALNADLVDPTSSASGSYGGEVAALRLNIAFGDDNLLGGTSGLHLGDLHLCAFTDVTQLNGMTVRQFQDLANTLLGGGTGIYAIADIFPTIANINMSFNGGPVTTFAQTHLINGACP
jgi:hypothetical protein